MNSICSPGVAGVERNCACLSPSRAAEVKGFTLANDAATTSNLPTAQALPEWAQLTLETLSQLGGTGYGRDTTILLHCVGGKKKKTMTLSNGGKYSLSLLFLCHSVFTCVSHVTETHPRDTISMPPTVVWTGLRDVDAIQGKRWSISVHTALLEPAEPRFTGK